MSRAANLFRLQQIDSEMDSRRARVREITAALGEDAAVQSAQAALSAAEAQVAATRSAARAGEAAIEALAAKLAEAEAQLYGGKVRIPKELQDLQAEVESLKRRRADLEDRLLETMIRLDEAEDMRRAAAAALAEAERRYADTTSNLLAEKEGLEGALSRLGLEREAAEAPVSPADRALYAALRQRKHGVAVARVMDSACGSCGVAPSSSRLQAARQGGDLVRCGNCERILYAV